MENKLLKKFFFYFCRIFPALFLLTIFLIPISIKEINLNDTEAAAGILYPYLLPLTNNADFYAPLLHFFFFLVYLIPAAVVILISSIFTKAFSNKTLYYIVLSSLTIYLFCAVSCMIIAANTLIWFTKIPTVTYVFFILAFLFHLGLSITGIIYNRISNPEYAEYKQLRKDELLKNKTSEKKTQKRNIKTKLTLSIITTIAVILFTFMALILRRYQNLITETVSETGRTRAEQTAAIYETAEGKNDKISYFFSQQKKANEIADTPFERIDIIITDAGTNIYLEEIDQNTNLPDYNVFAYTTTKRSRVPEEELTIPSEKAHEYIKRFQTGAYRKTPIYNKTLRTCKYVYPITFSRKAGSKLLGFAIVTYREDVLMQAYFKTKVSVLALSFVFLYLSIILTLFLSDYIADPLLFLRTNVRKTSESLSTLLSGRGKINASTITFEDTITTKDEIKDLSTEIGDMVSLIRGIVPYISFSTLKHADAETKKSVSRELCFLFTDIRGFTTLCEGRAPKEIVSILNHYLDIETEIILKNGGDIDKFVGDEMMAFFAGPRKEINACKAAMEIRAAMKEQQKLSKEKGRDYISMGIGINTGNVVFGSVGSKTRMDFTSIGDTVNLAARLEGANKAYGSKAIITEAVYDKLNEMFICRELDFIKVKGKTEPVRIYEILQIKSQASDKLDDIKLLFEKGLHFYRRQNWEKATQYFKECNDKYYDLPSQVFLERIRHFKHVPPPAKWDGVFEMKVK